MIQVLALRDFTDQKSGHTKKREVFFNKGWRFDKIEQIFNTESLNELIERIPLQERCNLYFTVADCFEESGRKLKEQWAIPFDIDDLAIEDGTELAVAESAARAAADVIGVPFEEMGVTFSGNGVQFFVQLTTPILSEDYFEQTRVHYNVVCRRIQNKLDELSIKGKVDNSVWSKARLMRMPNTTNKKPGRPERIARILNGTMKPQVFDIIALSGITHLEEAQHIPEQVLKNYPKPDTKSVLDGCDFLKRCKAEPNEVSEPEYYAMISITARLEDGRNLSHEYSSEYHAYNHYETENKIDQALASAGPRTCKNIDTLWSKCQGCAFYGKVTSPIMIKSEDYVVSVDFGFRERVVDKKTGAVRSGKPAYLDLVRTFELEMPYRVIAGTKQVFTYDGRKWAEYQEPFIRSWAMGKVRPEPTVTEMTEFVGILKSFNVATLESFYVHSDGYMPFKNLVLNRKTGETLTHKPEFGFFHTLDFDYDPRAEAPRWEQFLSEVMSGNESLVQTLKEFGGYCISGDKYWLQQAMFLVGEGANGKSVFMEMLGEVVGDAAHSAVAVQALSDPTNRYSLVNKLFNYSEETSTRALNESETFKTAVVGGKIRVKQLYVQPYEVFNRAKFICSANELPYSSDKSDGLYRRLAIVRFKRQFKRGMEGFDPFIKDKLREELPGICNGLLKAYATLVERRELLAQEELSKELEAYKYDSDPVHEFYQHHLEVSDNQEQVEKVAEVYEHYRMMCDVSGFKPVHVTQFGKQLIRIDSTFNDRRDLIRINGAVSRVWRGVKLSKEF